jgi:hypothetical protein
MFLAGEFQYKIEVVFFLLGLRGFLWVWIMGSQMLWVQVMRVTLVIIGLHSVLQADNANHGDKNTGLNLL